MTKMTMMMMMVAVDVAGDVVRSMDMAAPPESSTDKQVLISQCTFA